MVRVSTKPVALLATLLLLGTTAYSQNQPWPLKGEIDLSSGYGDFRAGRFHVGLDLRTGGHTGAKVYSPVDGWVWRVSMSYRGYGKGLYIKGADDHIYVFGHLSGFNKGIEATVRAEQFRAERYYIDVYYLKDSVPVRKGELIAYSGQTGVGAPHLHFEKRTQDNVPVNPLKHGFSLKDNVPPTFERVGIQLLDDQSLFAQGRRIMFLPVRKVGSGEYRVQTTAVLSAPFGLLIDGYDQMRAGSMRQSIYKLTLYIDSIPYYESALDTLPFEIGAAVALVFDPAEAANGEKRVRRVYRPVPPESIWPETRAGYGGRSPGSCAYGVDSPPRPGVHQVHVVGEDVSGNRSELAFSFRYVEPGSNESWVIDPFREFPNSAAPELTEYELTEDGMISQVKVNGGSRFLFFRPRPSHESLLDRRDLKSFGLDAQLQSRGVSIDVVGWDGGRELISSDQKFVLRAPKGTLFRTQFVTVERVAAPKNAERLLRSEVYDVRPPALPMRGRFEIAIRLDSGIVTNRQTGLCWYDKLEKEWVWIDEDTARADLAAGRSSGGGQFAAIVDTTAPVIDEVNLAPGHRYWNRRPEVKFRLTDNLSGFADDRSIDIRVDGRWLLPEYDFETGSCVAALREPLELGTHVLIVSAVDRAGNRAEKKIEFEIVKRSKN